MRAFLTRNQLYGDVVVAAVFLTLWLVAEAGRHSVVYGSRVIEGSWWAAVVLLAASIAISRRWPIAAMAGVAVLLLGQLMLPWTMFDAPAQSIYFGLLLVIAGVAAASGPRLRVLSALFAVGTAIGVAGLLAAYTTTERFWPTTLATAADASAVMSNRVWIFVAVVLVAAAAWALGASARLLIEKRRTDAALAQTAAELERAEVEATVTEERERIAQDVHDIMAHSLSVILAQADGARFLADERPEAVPASLATIADTARMSLTEVRVLIETLVSDPVGHSAPALTDLDELVRRLRSSGLGVEVERFGRVEGLTPAQELAAYRIVQEGLTNALKHGGRGATARVVLDGRAPGLALSISSSSSGRAEVAAASGGRGLHGMRERARLAGGWLEAGEDDAPGGYLVTGYIPAGVPA